MTRVAPSWLASAAILTSLPLALATQAEAQAPSLGAAGSFAVLAGTTVTNTGPSVINGDVGVWPGGAIVGFPPGIVTAPYAIHATDALAQLAQSDNVIAYNVLAGRPIGADLTGQNLGNRTLTAGVYGFNNAAQLTGTLVLDGQGNPNSVFIFRVGSTLTTASAASILLINGAQAGNVFFQVGSSATLGSSTSFLGEILALTSITLNTAATINCGAALAQNGSVTLDNNVITVCTTGMGAGQNPTPVDVVPPNIPSVTAIDTFVRNGGSLPPGFLELLIFLTPSELAAVLTQLSGESGTGVAQAGTQAMNSFLSLVTNPFADNRVFPPEAPVQRVYKQPIAKAAAAADPSRWNIWAAGYGGQNNADGNPVAASHDRSIRTYGYATGFDYRISPFTLVGFALAGGATKHSLSDGLGSGSSDMFQAAAYGITRVDAAYVSAALAYAWHRVSTERVLALLNFDRLTADFSAYDVGARIEGGYRFAFPSLSGWYGPGVTPYGAVQAQAFHTPSYNESGSALFALAYEARTTTTMRTELGVWLDQNVLIDNRTNLALRTRAAWAHDYWSDPTMTASFQSLPGSAFTITGAAPARDSLLYSAVAEVNFRNGISIGARFDGGLAEHSQTYYGSAHLRYTW